MSLVLVAIANPERAPLSAALIGELAARFETSPAWLAESEAAEMSINTDNPKAARARADEIVAAFVDPGTVDIALLPAGSRRKRLLISDMDSTIITVECIDELADFAGVKTEVAAITRRAMAGELDFAGALHERVALLEGLSVDVIDQVYAERVRPMPGARTLVRTMRRFGAATALVSGGFLPFAERVADDLGFETVVANSLETVEGRLTGHVLPPITGADAKLSTLKCLMSAHELNPDETLAVGDGANDLPMVVAAGLGVAFHPHAVLAAAGDVTIQAGDLTALLYLQGVPKAEFFNK